MTAARATAPEATPATVAMRRWRRRRLLLFALCFGPPLLYLLIFMVLPYLRILQFSFWRVDLYTIAQDFNLENYREIFENPLYRTVILKSLKIAAIVTVCVNLIGYPLALFLAFVAQRHRTLLYFLVIVPLWTSFLLRAYTWKLILGRSGLINGVLQYTGLTDEPVSLFLYNEFSVSLALVYIFVPFLVLPVYTALERIPQEYVEASLDLGANNFYTFRRVVLPLSLPGVLAGSTFAFCLSFGDFVTPSLLGGPGGIMVSNVIIGQFGAAFNWPLGSALAMTVVVVVFSVVILASRLERRRGEAIV
jgi:spermidine/putrescine transport system permease protein